MCVSSVERGACAWLLAFVLSAGGEMAGAGCTRAALRAGVDDAGCSGCVDRLGCAAVEAVAMRAATAFAMTMLRSGG
eukprot:4711412-Pleurochrysis_carterae.AAC.3